MRAGLSLLGRAISPGWHEVGRFLGASIEASGGSIHSRSSSSSGVRQESERRGVSRLEVWRGNRDLGRAWRLTSRARLTTPSPQADGDDYSHCSIRPIQHGISPSSRSARLFTPAFSLSVCSRPWRRSSCRRHRRHTRSTSSTAAFEDADTDAVLVALADGLAVLAVGIGAVGVASSTRGWRVRRRGLFHRRRVQPRAPCRSLPHQLLLRALLGIVPPPDRILRGARRRSRYRDHQEQNCRCAGRNRTGATGRTGDLRRAGRSWRCRAERG